MSLLYLVPLAPSISLLSLEQTAEVINREFHLLYVGVKTTPSLKMIDETKDLVRDESVSCADLLRQLSLRGHGREILAITNLKLTKSDGTLVSGVSDYQDRKAIVSRYGFHNTSFSEDALIAASLHEVGHFFRLQHHVTINHSGKYCPMTSLYELAKRDNLQKPALEYFTEFDHTFCSDCANQLKNHH